MLFQWPNSTNKGNAFLRLIDQFQPQPFLKDKYVSWFFSDEEMPSVQASAYNILKTPANDRERHELNSYWWVLLRERYIDEVLCKAVQSGARQLLLLGAGFDTRFLRLPEISQCHVDIYELDLPQTISTKKGILTAKLGNLPPQLKLIAGDLNEQKLHVIFDHGFNPHAQSICIWQGVTYYLPESSVLYILKFLKSELAPGLILSFDCPSPLMIYPNDEVPGIRDTIKLHEELGEPFRFGLDSLKMKGLLAHYGYRMLEIQYPDDLEAYYHRPRTLPRNMWYLVTARTEG
jgi:methyltransferase (TIGR00027 family)